MEALQGRKWALNVGRMQHEALGGSSKTRRPGPLATRLLGEHAE